MPNRLEIMMELDRRGKLPADLKPAFDEAKRRGLLGGGEQSTGAGEDVAAQARDRLRSSGGGFTDQITAGLAGANLGLAELLGLPGTLARGVSDGVTGALNMIPGVNIDPDQAARFNVLAPGRGIPTGQDMRESFRDMGLTRDVTDVYDLPENQRMAGRAGEALGAAAAAAPIPFLGASGAAIRQAAPHIPQMSVRSMTDPIRSMAINNPRTALAAEAAVAGGAAQGAAGAELLAPGNRTVGTLAEIGGGLANPAGMLASGARGAVRGAQRTVQAYTPRGRMAAAQDEVSRILREAGEDPAILLARLDEANDLGLSVVDRTASPTLRAALDAAGRQDPALARRVQEGDRAAEATMAARMRELIDPGDTAALTRAAGAEAGRRQEGLEATRMDAQARAADIERTASQQADDLFNRATEQARQAAGRFDVDQAGRVAASRGARDTLSQARKNADDMEDALWGWVDRSTPVSARGTLATRDQLEQELPVQFGESIRGGEVGRQLKRIEDEMMLGLMPDAGTLLNLRSSLLRAGRQAYQGADPNPTLGSMYYRLANSLLDDLAPVPNAEQARAFSRAIHDRFDRSMAGEYLATGPGGRDRVSADQTLDRAFQGNAARRDEQFRDLELSTTPIRGRAPGGPVATRDLSPQMLEDQAQFLRAEVGRFMDPVSGRITNPRRAETFLRDNAPLLERFPQVRDDLRTALDTEARATRAGRTAEGWRERGETRARGVRDEAEAQIGAVIKADKQSAFQRVLDAGEQPVRAVANALTGPNPARDYKRLADLARRQGDDAVAGLRAATFDHLKARAMSGPDEAIDFNNLANGLFRPPTDGGPNLLQMMRDNGVITTTQRARIERAVRRAVERQAVMRSGDAPAQFVEDVSDVWDLMIRLGATKAQSLSPFAVQGPGAIVASGAAVRFGRRLMERVPNMRTRENVFRILEDEDLLRAALTKDTNAREFRQAERLLRGVLYGTTAREIGENMNE